MPPSDRGAGESSGEMIAHFNVLAEIGVDGRDVRVRHGRRSARLAQEPPPSLVVRSGVITEHPPRDGSPEASPATGEGTSLNFLNPKSRGVAREKVRGSP